MNYDHLSTIKHVISSEYFSKSLIEINENFFNLKQESHIRNSLLIQLNNYFRLSGLAYKAISEHPRVKGTRVDLSIVDLNELDKIFTIEFKFQFIGDYKGKDISNRTNEVEYDLIQKNSDLFILIVVEWERGNVQKLDFDQKHGLNTSLTRYNKDGHSDWKKSLEEIFIQFSSAKNWTEENIQIEQPYLTIYNFFFLQNEQKK